jgi:hypothetical protein
MISSHCLVMTIRQSWIWLSYIHIYCKLWGWDDGFNLTNRSVCRLMHSLLRELNDLLSTEYQLNVSGISNHRTYVRVPRTKSNSSFRNSKEWLNTAIKISGSKQGGIFELAYHITNHIIRYYHDSFLADCETQQVPVCNPMSGTQFQAMISAANVSGTGERELKNIRVLTLEKASVQQDVALTCCLRATPKFTMAALNSHMMEKRGQS